MSNVIEHKMQRKELGELVCKMIDLLCQESNQIRRDLDTWDKAEDSLEKLATMAELKIRRNQLKRLLRGIKGMLDKTVYKMIILTIDTESN